MRVHHRITPPPVRPLAWLLAAALSLGATAAAGEAPARWYQVELIIFTQQSAGSDPQELWPRDIALAYPPNWVELKAPDSPSPAQPDAPQQTAGTETAAETSDTPPVDLAREPYYRLPPEDREMTPQARDLRRGNRYRVLFHETWRQPMVAIQKAPAILIQGGQSYGKHTELEGSITISIARYLHLNTNLWLAEFSANYGQEPGGWPDLPSKPVAPQAGSAPVLAFDTPAVDTQATDWWENRQQTGSEYENILASPFITNRVVTFRQKRSRIRSGEVHYLDHPLMGLLIKMKPYEVPEVEPEKVEPEKFANNGNPASVQTTPAVSR